MGFHPYEARSWDHSAVEGLSHDQLDAHYQLYKGYVTNTNSVLETIHRLVRTGSGATPECNELKRRLGWEFDGMRMHELYFDNLKGPHITMAPGSGLHRAIEDFWGSVDNWHADFVNTGKMRGIGWVCLYKDGNGNMINQWVGEHEIGHLPECRIIIAMDVWEHAYTVDWKPTERPLYIEAFMRNIAWDVGAARYDAA